MSGRQKFEADILNLLSKLTINAPKSTITKITGLKDWLIKLQKENVVKINHSVMELVCAKYLIQRDYDVQLEYSLNELLTCDLFATKGFGNLIVEIETGFIPPENALAPMTYTSARLASKIIRYSSFAGKFALGVPPHYILPFPLTLAKSPRNRTDEEIAKVKRLVDVYYHKPPVTVDEIRNARLHEIQIIDVDKLTVQEIDPEAYLKRAIQKGITFEYMPPEEQ
ncbi:MAG: hypothetical protein FWG55_08890 [Candidatus Bathyarchaeota archaeon]|nr:hypothetical protein [Candidatus Termiticorpusculum sp.]